MTKKKQPPANKQNQNGNGNDGLVEILAPEGDAKLIRQKGKITLSELHIGPLPHCEDFSRYEEVCPGAAQTILDMAVDNQKALIAFKKRGQIFNLVESVLGQISGLISFSLVVGGSLWALLQLVDKSAEKPAFVVLGAFLTIGAFATIRKFIDGRPRGK